MYYWKFIMNRNWNIFAMSVDVVGINNRDLKTFKVDINHSIELGKKIPSQKIKISESGLDDVKTILSS